MLEYMYVFKCITYFGWYTYLRYHYWAGGSLCIECSISVQSLCFDVVKLSLAATRFAHNQSLAALCVRCFSSLLQYLALDLEMTDRSACWSALCGVVSAQCDCFILFYS